ncbi:MAG: hypothetical protein QM762_21375 [Chryseolinea sp.]
MKKEFSFVQRNGLTLVLLVLFVLSLCGQIVTGLDQYNSEIGEYGYPPVSLAKYLRTGHFIETTFENWESEFLQMGMYVLLTVWLKQKGSSESKDLEQKEEVDRQPDPLRPGAPWPVRRGGFVLRLYKSSLSIAFGLLFITSFMLHANGSLRHYNAEQSMKGQPSVELGKYMTMSRFWFESFQNWQSEFISVAAIVVLSIYFRQFGSPESKPVDASMEETGS